MDNTSLCCLLYLVGHASCQCRRRALGIKLFDPPTMRHCRQRPLYQCKGGVHAKHARSGLSTISGIIDPSRRAKARESACPVSVSPHQMTTEKPSSFTRSSGTISCSGMMGASQVIYSEPSRDQALKKIESLKSTIQDILKIAMRENRPTSDVANDMALQRI